MINKIKKLSEEYFAEIQAIRRHLHAHPELSYQENNTIKYIVDQLKSWGVDVQFPVADTGCIATIKGALDGKPKALRADIDALPIQEANDVSYKSQNDGVMHACGHDVHTACALGAVKILHSLKDQLRGEVKVLFQPAEEKLPGGASLMIKAGCLTNPEPEFIVGQHVHPPLEVGKIGVKSGMYMASADEVYLTIKGRGGHAALPHDTIDPVIIAANILVQIQQVLSRKSDPTIPSVLSFGKINSEGGATNVIPNKVMIEGTFRTMDETWRKEAHKWITKTCKNLAQSMGGDCEVDIRVGYPSLYNHPGVTENFFNNAIAYLGPENVVKLPIRMTAEDFAYYSQKIPACFYRLGTGNPAKGIESPVHTNTFDIDEHALEIGMGLMAWSVLSD